MVAVDGVDRRYYLFTYSIYCIAERKGKERKGKERKGKERKGKERKGKEYGTIVFKLQ